MLRMDSRWRVNRRPTRSCSSAGRILCLRAVLLTCTFGEENRWRVPKVPTRTKADPMHANSGMSSGLNRIFFTTPDTPFSLPLGAQRCSRRLLRPSAVTWRLTDLATAACILKCLFYYLVLVLLGKLCLLFLCVLLALCCCAVGVAALVWGLLSREHCATLTLPLCHSPSQQISRCCLRTNKAPSQPLRLSVPLSSLHLSALFRFVFPFLHPRARSWTLLTLTKKSFLLSHTSHFVAVAACAFWRC
mmetsp:Transcript_21804/g.40831  ORF Transcript_21804/g.40831 Transcript_21804/m.40831 type:complete len:246 (-) Transcript_21804:379-1116(-)